MGAREKVGDLKPAPFNPRRISEKKLTALGKAMREFGDLGGVVVNVRTNRIVGGHQRVKNLQPDWEITKKASKDKTGTVAAGTIQTPWGPFGYREVDWDEKKEKAANIAANAHGGDWDQAKLRGLVAELNDGDMDMDIVGFDEEELKKLIAEGGGGCRRRGGGGAGGGGGGGRKGGGGGGGGGGLSGRGYVRGGVGRGEQLYSPPIQK